LVVEAQARGIPLSNDSQIFLEAAPCPVIGITGSAGKTTTATLVGRIVEAGLGPERTWVGGNIGNPLISDLEHMRHDHLAVMELSSFQLEIMTVAPKIAGVLNITPNHLDRHITMEAYTNAKARILDYQTPDDIAVLGKDDTGSWGVRDRVKGSLVTFSKDQPLTDQPGVFVRNSHIAVWDGRSIRPLLCLSKIALRGRHNLANVLAACALTWSADLPVEAIHAGVEGFTGVDHRLEFVRTWRESDWYNDSIATAPERAIAAIQSFDRPLVLLAGGRDKDLPWGDFARVVRQKVDHLILFGEAKEIIFEQVMSVNTGSRPFTFNTCANLSDAVQVASEIVQPGDVVLLSPGGTSFDEFTNFEERGVSFRKWVNQLP
jgi:UDP-N-acetylmuramoylalanine--D-glutamate ligase